MWLSVSIALKKSYKPHVVPVSCELQPDRSLLAELRSVSLTRFSPEDFLQGLS